LLHHSSTLNIKSYRRKGKRKAGVQDKSATPISDGKIAKADSRSEQIQLPSHYSGLLVHKKSIDPSFHLQKIIQRKEENFS